MDKEKIKELKERLEELRGLDDKVHISTILYEIDKCFII